MNKNLLLYLLFGVFIIGNKHCYCDIALSYFQTNLERFFNMAPKIWHNYIRMFMYRYLKYSQLEKRKLNNLIFKTYKYSFILLALRDKSIESNKLSKSQIPYKVNVTWASGMIYVSVSTYKIIPYTLHFYFNINSEIRLNMTFISLHLSEVFLKCKYDKLEVHNSNETEMKYKYCGYHSNFNFYPEFGDLFIIIKLYLKIPFHFNAKFSVTDNKLIFNPTSYPRSSRLSNTVSLRSKIYDTIKTNCYKIGSQYFVTSFHINIIKFFRIYLRFFNVNENNHVIYDGPGYGFNILKRNGEKSSIFTSTFQCLVQFLVNDIFHWSTLFYHSNAENDNTNFKKIYIESEIVIQFPFINCWNNLCVHLLEHTRGLFLNFTVLNISVNSPETSTCLYQGLYIGEYWKDNFRSIDEMCLEFNISSQSLMPTFHTRGSSLWIALYWYEGFTSITAAISVSASKCQGVYLNICKYHQHCMVYNFNKTIDYKDYNEDNLNKIKHFINEVTHGTKLHFYDCHSLNQKQRFKLPGRECVILILSDKLDHFEYLNRVCKITLSTERASDERHETVKKIPYIDGFLGEGNYIEIVGHKSCFFSKQSMYNQMFNDRIISEYHHMKFVKRFKQHLSSEIDTVRMKINFRQYRNQVNIMLIGLSKKRIDIQYALIAYKPNVTTSDVLLGVTLQLGYAMGLDLMLSADRNLQINPKDGHILCSITIQRVVTLYLAFFTTYTNLFYIDTGKSLMRFDIIMF